MQAPVAQRRAVSRHIVDLGPGKKLVSTARNVLILGLDMTASMADWRHEVISRGEGMLDLMKKYTGTDDIQILILGFGDFPCRDNTPLMVAPDFGSDIVLADYLGALERQGGGGTGEESSQLVFQHALRMVDTSSATNVWVMVVTDERPYMETRTAEAELFFPGSGQEYPLETKDAVAMLRDRAEVYCVFCEGSGLGMDYDRAPFKKLWQEIVGEERVIPIEFKERIVDTALLLIANTVGQGDTFLADFIKRQKGTAFADVNINSVKKSMTVAQSGTGSKVSAPVKSRRSILDI